MSTTELCGLASVSLAAGLAFLSLIAWANAAGSWPQRLFAAYTHWYRQRAEPLRKKESAASFLRQRSLVAASIAAAYLVVSGSPFLLAAAAGLGLLWLTHLHLDFCLSRRRTRLRAQLDSALMMMAGCIKTTGSLDASLRLVAETMQPPIAEEFAHLIASHKLGQSLEQAVRELGLRSQDPYISAASVALIIGQRTGGNLGATLNQVADSTREALRVERELHSKTQGQRSQLYLVLVLYPVALCVLRSSVPEIWSPLVGTPNGLGALVISGCAWLGAALWAREILRLSPTTRA